MGFFSVVLGVFLVLSSCNTVQSAIVYVSTTSQDDNCIHTTRDNPCGDLDASLKLIKHQSNSALLLFPGNYTLPSNTKYTFNEVTNLTISKVDNINSTVPVVIKCIRSTQSNTGLGFIDVKDIHIVGVSFDGCGVIRNSTSRDFNSEHKLSLVPVMVTLYFDNCENVVLSSISVSRSVGVAVQMYSTNGTVEIVNSNFIDSTPDDIGLWGGGVYIEFPYCKPGDLSCDSPQSKLPVDILSVSNANYEIRNCIFRNNQANDSDTSHMVLAYQAYHKSMASGGGLSIFLKGSSKNNNFNISNCVFDGNSALYGGGMYVEMQDSAHGNSVYLSDSHFKNNYAKFQGGGLLASYMFVPELTNGDVVTNCEISLHSVSFDSNQVGDGGKGGGVSYVTTRQHNESVANMFSLFDLDFTSNTAFIGSAIRISVSSIVPSGYLAPIEIEHLNMFKNIVKFSSSKARPLGSGALYVSHVPLTISGKILMISNKEGTALAAYHCKIQVSENSSITFMNNTGYNGGALSLHSTSILQLGESVKLFFFWNKAFDKGGAIYADYMDASIDVETQACFIQYHNISTNPRHWNVSVKFFNNTIRDYIPNSIHASTLHPCILGQPYGVVKNEQELLKEVFCWNSNDSSIIWNYEGDDCSQYITSDLRTFDKSVTSTPLQVIPGRPVFMNLSGFDDQLDVVNTSIIAHAYSLNKDDGVDVDSAYTYISNNEIKLKNRKKAKNATIQLDTVGQQLEVQTTLSIQFMKCPPGLSLNESTGFCSCNGTFGGVLKCDSGKLNASLLSGYWIGEQSECKTMDNQAVVSHCQYCDFKNFSSASGYYELGDDWNELERKLCGENRHGHMCSLCNDGYKPAINIHKFNCVECKSVTVGVVLFVVFNILCPLLFIVAIFFMDVPLTDGLLHGPIFFAQMVTTVVTLDAEDIIQYKQIAHGFDEWFEQVYYTVYDVFNLGFFMNFMNKCIGFDHFSRVVCLQFLAALVPMIVVLSFWGFITCCNRNRCCTSNMKEWFQKRFENIANVMATCILLSYTKLTVIASFLVTPISLVSSDSKFGDYSHSVLYIDGSICYPSKKLLVYLILSAIVTVCFLIPVPLITVFFRFKSDESRGGFFDKLLKQFQRQFRNGKEDFPSLSSTTEDDSTTTRRCNHEQKVCVHCDPLCTCYGRDILDNRTECIYGCCTPNYICKYYQKKSRRFPFSINTSFSIYDLRWISGFMFILRIIMVLPFVLAWTSVIRYCLQLSICVIAGMLVLIVKPYKKNLYKYVDCNRVEAFFFFNLAFLISLCIYQYNYSTTSGLQLSTWVYILQILSITVPFVWIVIVYAVLLKEKYKVWLGDKVRPYLVMCCSMPDRVSTAGRSLVPINEDNEDDEDDDNREPERHLVINSQSERVPVVSSSRRSNSSRSSFRGDRSNSSRSSFRGERSNSLV